MKKLFNSTIISVGLAIFSMLFGAGNLVYPILVGITAGDQYLIGMLGFLLTGVCLPVIGLVSTIFFNGSYELFFDRLGKNVGKVCIFLCMLIIGPLLAVPRIVTLSHTMIAPFLPIPLNETGFSSVRLAFAVIFLLAVFLGTFHKERLISFIGYVISPTLLIALLIIIVKGILTAEKTFVSEHSAYTTFAESLLHGYSTLDLFGGIFFSSIIVSAIASSTKSEHLTKHQQALMALKAGALGASLLALIYTGIGFLGAYHGPGLEFANVGELFRDIAFKILAGGGSLVITLAVLLACYSTAISLATVIASYAHLKIFRGRISFIRSLIITLCACIPLSVAGLGKVLELTGGPITYIGYPALIALTFSNLAYKLWGFKPVKTPVLVTFVTFLILYYVR